MRHMSFIGAHLPHHVGHTAHDLQSLVHVEFKIEAILQYDSMQVNDWEGPGQTRITWGQIFELVFSNKKRCFRTSLLLVFQKCHFYFCSMSINAQNRSLKKMRHQRIRFLGYMFAKNRYINLKFGMIDVNIWLCSIYPFSENFENFGFLKRLKIKFFYIFSIMKDRKDIKEWSIGMVCGKFLLVQSNHKVT